MITAVIRDLKKFEQEFKKEAKQQYANAKDAVKVECFKKRELLQSEIAAGAPGGIAFKPITEIWRRCRKAMGKDEEAPPLSMLSKVIRYKVNQTEHDMTFSFGFGIPSVSNSWKRIARVHQEGGMVESRINLKHYQSKSFFILKPNQQLSIARNTKMWNLPERNIIEPFIRKYQTQMLTNIKNNFERKSRGEWIA